MPVRIFAASCVFLALAAGAHGNPTVAGSAASSPPLKTGEARIEAALAALGGLEALDRAGGITWTGVGRDDVAEPMANGSMNPPDFQPLTEALSYRTDDGQLAFETHSAVAGNDREWVRKVFPASGPALTVDRQLNLAYWDDRDDVMAEALMHRNLIVHELLAAVLDRGADLQRLPSRPFFGQPAEAVAGTLPDGTPVTLFVGQTDVLLGAAYPLSGPFIGPTGGSTLGPTTMTWVYDTPVDVEGLGPYPAGHRVYLDDRLIREVRYEELHAGPDPALMQTPEGIEAPRAVIY